MIQTKNHEEKCSIIQMGLEYVLIRSENRGHIHADSQIDVHLSKPIENAVSCKMTSLSIANDFYNVHTGNNKFTILSYSRVKEDPPWKSTVEIPAGFYSVIAMKDAVLASLQDAFGMGSTPAAGLLNDNMTEVEFSVSTEGYCQITMKNVSATTNAWRCVLFHPSNHTFKTSIVHRLGFSRQQVSAYAYDDLMYLDETGEYSGTEKNRARYLLKPQYKRDVLDTRFRKRDPDHVIYSESNRELSIQEDDSRVPFIFWVPWFTQKQVRKAHHIGFETDPCLYVRSNLVNHFQVTNLVDGVSTSQSDSILAKVEIAVNRGSWIQHNANNTDIVHALNGSTISEFTVALSDYSGRNFMHNHYKDFSLILEFETLNNDLVNRNSIKALRREMFLKKNSI